jgi:hypothetical protein
MFRSISTLCQGMVTFILILYLFVSRNLICLIVGSVLFFSVALLMCMSDHVYVC